MGKDVDKDSERNGKGGKPSEERGHCEEGLNTVNTQSSELSVDHTQIEKKVRARNLPQFSSMRESNLPKPKKAQPVLAHETSAKNKKAVSEALIPVVSARNITAPSSKKAKLDGLCDFLGPAGAPSPKKAPVLNEDDEHGENPPESVAPPKRNRSSLPPLAVELVTHARRENVSVRKLLLTGRAYELVQQARDNKRNAVVGPESKKAIVEAKETNLHDNIRNVDVGPKSKKAIVEAKETNLHDKKQNRALEEESKKHIVEAKQTITFKTNPKEKTARPASPMPSSSPRMAASRLTTPEHRSSLSPHNFATSPASPASTSGASSSANTPVKLPTAAKPVTVSSDGTVTFQSPESYATYKHSLQLLENSHKRKASKKEKKKRQDH